MADNQDELWASLGVTINLGSYESARLDAGARRVLKPGDDRSEVWDDLWAEVDLEIERKVKEIKADLEKK